MDRKIIYLILLVATLILGEVVISFLNRPSSQTVENNVRNITSTSNIEVLNFNNYIKLGNASLPSFLEEECINKEFKTSEGTLVKVKEGWCIPTLKYLFNLSSPVKVTIMDKTLNITSVVEISYPLPLKSEFLAEMEYLLYNNEYFVVSMNPLLKDMVIEANISPKYVENTTVLVFDFSNRSLAEKYGRERNLTAKIYNVVFVKNPRKLDYVKYIGEGYIVVDENVTKERVLQDFPNATFKDSLLFIGSLNPEEFEGWKKAEALLRGYFKITSTFGLPTAYVYGEFPAGTKEVEIRGKGSINSILIINSITPKSP